MARILAFIVLVASVPALAGVPALNPGWAKTVAECKPSQPSPRHVWIFKQWHLAPAENTRFSPRELKRPQEANQAAIYLQLESWIRKGLITQVYAEGCEGELDHRSTLAINGWTVNALQERSSQKEYERVVTSVPLKLEAVFGDKLKTTCGDSLAMVKENALAFSDARGAAGFLGRLEEHRANPAKLKLYLDGVIEAYKMPPETTSQQASVRLLTELRNSVQKILQIIERRNAQLVSAIKSSSQKSVAVVFGGIHADGIRKLLEKDGLGCSVVEPAGYESHDVELLEHLQKLLGN